MLPPFHGQRMGGDAEMMAEVTREVVGSWPSGEPFELWPHMQAITQEVIMRSVFGPDEAGRLDRLRTLLGQLTEALNDPRRLSMAAALGCAGSPAAAGSGPRWRRSRRRCSRRSTGAGAPARMGPGTSSRC